MATFIGSRDDPETTPAGSTLQAVEDSFQTLQRVPLFEPLTEPQRNQVLVESERHRVERHQLVHCEGEQLRHLYVVLSGSLKLVRHSPEGKELIVALVRRGGVFGALTAPTEAATLSQALESTAFLRVPLAAVKRLVAEQPAFAHALVAQADAMRRAAETTAFRIAFDSVPRRLASLLLDESDAETGELLAPLNQSEIANLIGAAARRYAPSSTSSVARTCSPSTGAGSAWSHGTGSPPSGSPRRFFLARRHRVAPPLLSRLAAIG